MADRQVYKAYKRAKLRPFQMGSDTESEKGSSADWLSPLN